MARIRTIKPEFFTSESVLSVSPLARLFFIGLWCEADREGRLKWKPKTLKFRYLPADNVDIDQLASELEENDMIKVYSVSDVDYCEVTGFTTHQVVNNRERASEFPSRLCDASTTREPRVKAEGRKGKEGKEGKGKEGNENNMSAKADNDQVIDAGDHADHGPAKVPSNNDHIDIFNYWRDVMRKDPSRTSFSPKRLKAVKARLKDFSVEDIKMAILNCSRDPWSMGQNDRGKPFNDLELICRTSEKLESYFDPAMPITGKRDVNQISSNFDDTPEGYDTSQPWEDQ